MCPGETVSLTRWSCTPTTKARTWRTSLITGTLDPGAIVIKHLKEKKIQIKIIS